MDMIVIVLWLFFHGQIPILSQMCREQHSAMGRGWRKVRSTEFPCQGLGVARKGEKAKNAGHWEIPPVMEVSIKKTARLI